MSDKTVVERLHRKRGHIKRVKVYIKRERDIILIETGWWSEQINN